MFQPQFSCKRYEYVHRNFRAQYAFRSNGKDQETLAEAREPEGTLGDGFEQDDYSN